jgi:hypothetical protein
VALPVFAQTSVEAYQSTLFAGNNAALTIIDGPGVDARFQSITAMWGSGTSLYVADSSTIRRIDLSSPAKQVTTLSQTASNGMLHRGTGVFGNIYGGLYGLWGNDSFLYAMFLDEIPNLFPSDGAYFVRLSTPAPAGVSVIGLRGRYNERGEFLITTTPATPEDTNPDLTPRYIAHVVDGGGYTTQFVFFSATAQSATTGFTVTTRYVSQTGTALALPNQ